MKLPIVLFFSLVLLNLLSLYFLIGLFGGEGLREFTVKIYYEEGHTRVIVYLFYITVLFNLYALFYVGVRRFFKD